MSIEVTKNKDWFSDKGTTLKLFDQLLLFLNKETPIGKEVVFLNDVRIDFLALTDFDTKNKEYFKEILNKVLDYNKEQQGADLYDASAFPQYYNKLLELHKMLE